MARKQPRGRASNPSATLTRVPAPAQAAGSDSNQEQGTIVFFHPDLGIGGAERLVVDAAVGLQARGHKVVIFTNHCDPGHCFDECRDGTLDVRVRASRLIPMSVFSRLTILCAILRHMLLLVQIALTGELVRLAPRALIVDQLSAGLPLLTYLCPAAPILFYCHFPDLLLASGRDTSALKRLYRVPFDKLEAWTMQFAASTAVNSEFTKSIVTQTWPTLAASTTLRTVYPCVDLSPTSSSSSTSNKAVRNALDGEKLLLSINRFERKKDIALAIKAFAGLAQRKNVRLVLAGGYDPRIDENVQYLSELRSLCDSLSLGHATVTATESLAQAPPVDDAPVLFLPSVPSDTKTSLLRHARLLLYTPASEHFGIVPLEAMKAKLPVLAATTGGPRESVVDGKTGWLRPTTDVAAWTDVMATALDGQNDGLLKTMGEQGLSRVREVFSRDSMAETLDGIIADMEKGKPVASALLNMALNAVVVLIAFIIGIGGAKGYIVAKDRVVWAWKDVASLIKG
ncbi:uncharacterized protein F5Z01DRAFT_649410 [Emericellopsis atlantica]|uniref:Alpha-1,3/1,6-mannosyltransferase ALG2 n=1 Tax=Emericellopsis atlantica TaxID=2614577 RepID=A0A9P7ZQV9_9HYPO|nr:uncharacterized protein F5Z01DRAFT_649410 [Emericellopsis atlantica]KAG9256177.1 hypothetical protein F5Z01DRAFT_649410 [Emericellopsis atlantica]